MALSFMHILTSFRHGNLNIQNKGDVSNPAPAPPLGVPTPPVLPPDDSYKPYDLPVAVRERFVGNPRWAPEKAKGKYTPWADQPNATAAEKAIQGNMYEIWVPSSDLIAHAWVNPNAGAPEEHKYYCHGYGLGTYNVQANTGYTIDSGSTAKVLSDQSLFTRIVKEKKSWIPAVQTVPGNDSSAGNFNIKAGDTVAFWAYYNKKNEQMSLMTKDYAPFIPGTYLAVYHTAKIKTPIFKKKLLRGWYMSMDSVIISKNGPQPLKEYSLKDLLKQSYRETTCYGIYRHVDSAAPAAMTDPQRADLVTSKGGQRARAATINAATYARDAEDGVMLALVEEDPENPPK